MSAVFSADGAMVLTSSDDMTAKIWNSSAESTSTIRACVEFRPSCARTCTDIGGAFVDVVIVFGIIIHHVTHACTMDVRCRVLYLQCSFLSVCVRVCASLLLSVRLFPCLNSILLFVKHATL